MRIKTRYENLNVYLTVFYRTQYMTHHNESGLMIDSRIYGAV